MPNIMLLAKITPNFTTDNKEHYNFLSNYISTSDIYIYIQYIYIHLYITNIVINNL